MASSWLTCTTASPHIGQPVRLVRNGSISEGTVHAYCQGHERRPALWRINVPLVNCYEVLTESEVLEALELYKKRLGSIVVDTSLLQTFEMRAQQALEACIAQLVHSQILPKLCIVAALEDELQLQISSTAESSGSSNLLSGGATSSCTAPRYYYTSSASSLLLQDDSATKSLSSGTLPSVLAQRIRAGVQLAWNYTQAQQQQSGEGASLVRRSTRLPMTQVSKPQPVQRGGRVAMYLLDNLISVQDFSTENNMYLQPSLNQVLQWLAHNAHRSLASTAMQEALCQLGDTTTLSPHELISVDMLVLKNTHQEEDEEDEVLLQCTSDDSNLQDLSLLETTSFAKYKFAVTTKSELKRQESLKNLQEELPHYETKAFGTWRFKSIHGGYCKWPKWLLLQVEQEEKEEEEKYDDKTSEAPQDQAADQVVEEAQPATEASQPTTTTQAEAENADLQLAQSLQESTVTTTRRTTRGAASDQQRTLFYGGQSNLTQKQLQETLWNIICNATIPQSLVELQGITKEDVVNPIQRLRVALGRLLWKRNAIKQTKVHTNDSDAVVQQQLMGKGTLWQATSAEQEEQSSSSLQALVQYLKYLHETELVLRRLVLQHLTHISKSVISLAGDDRIGSLEAMDDEDFVSDDIEWQIEGHAYLETLIYRPTLPSDTTCRWWKIQDYCPAVPFSGGDERDLNSESLLSKGEVERRMRFRAVLQPNHEEEEEATMTFTILTQAQVHAGLEAAKLQQQQEQEATRLHPYSQHVGSNISLLSVVENHDAPTSLEGKIAGYDSVLATNSDDDKVLEHRILILPDDADQDTKPPAQQKESSDHDDAFWATLTLDDSCRVGDQVYKLEQSDYHANSQAYQACLSIVEYLENHPRAGVFLDPVDPVALNVPEYFDIIKRPMDVSTLRKNLEQGVYSKVPAATSNVYATTPVARMLQGPFQTDVVQIFDNAILFNPPDDWIHTTAISLKKSVLKKMETVSQENEETSRVAKKKKSIYVDEDSDVDIYMYESDMDDDDFGGKRKKRKRPQGTTTRSKEDAPTRAMEHPIRLQRIMNETSGLSGPFADLPIQSDALSFSLPPEWTCRRCCSTEQATTESSSNENAERAKKKKELMELLALQRQVEAAEQASLRRSTRAHDYDHAEITKSDATSLPLANVEYLLSQEAVPISAEKENFSRVVSDRAQVETAREAMHESYFARLFQELANKLTVSDYASEEEGAAEEYYGLFVNDSFPPFLGRIVPTSTSGAVTWEIRSPYVIPALRWVIRGLVHSGHLTELEPMLANDSPLSTGVVLPNNVFHYDSSLELFDVLDVKEMQRRKRANNAGESSDESEEVEMSEYEKLRAERVARNAERLKALGL